MPLRLGNEAGFARIGQLLPRRVDMAGEGATSLSGTFHRRLVVLTSGGISHQGERSGGLPLLLGLRRRYYSTLRMFQRHSLPL